MTRWAVVAILAITFASACSDEPDFGEVEAFAVRGPAGHLGDADRLEILTYRESMDGRPHGCWGLRAEGTVGYDDVGTGGCVEAGPVPELREGAFAGTTGPLPQGLVTPEAAEVRARLADDRVVSMKPYDHPDLDARVFGFSLPDTETVTRLEAVSSDGTVLGSAAVR